MPLRAAAAARRRAVPAAAHQCSLHTPAGGWRGGGAGRLASRGGVASFLRSRPRTCAGASSAAAWPGPLRTARRGLQGALPGPTIPTLRFLGLPHHARKRPPPAPRAPAPARAALPPARAHRARRLPSAPHHAPRAGSAGLCRRRRTGRNPAQGMGDRRGSTRRRPPAGHQGAPRAGLGGWGGRTEPLGAHRLDAASCRPELVSAPCPAPAPAPGAAGAGGWRLDGVGAGAGAAGPSGVSRLGGHRARTTGGSGPRSRVLPTSGPRCRLPPRSPSPAACKHRASRVPAASGSRC